MSSVSESAVPILPSGDLRRAEAFYRYLGFRATGRGADYLRVARGDIELHLYLAPGLDPPANPAGCYLRVADPAGLRAGWRADGVNCLDVAGSRAYGETVFALVDPDGNTLRYGPAGQSVPSGARSGGKSREWE
ncbi:VOC family protein [Actinospica sp.]|uniref:VOC family protein n=1 Tax=Actinospica sp. TaxID=1872142 RepID=UPI002C1B77D7|nr:VOC family protein [Actinospica sp.]HWG22974.1 VOC family protein [Actinospica sp.]